ncbi:hypothetical protein B566_EDAN007264 [Ephemera danica]|nr:hypothetical protein B566_EDAN007264 [Ephemera danica]
MTSQVVESMIVEEKTEPEKPINREKTCPLLLRVFCNTGRHHNIMDYNGKNVPANELQIYTWMDATLRELTSLVKEVNPEARRKGTIFDFALVVPSDHMSRGYNMQGGFRARDIGTTTSGVKGPDDSKTLSQVRFQIGDYMDIAITPPNMRVGPPMGMSAGGMPGQMRRGPRY